MSEHLPPPIHVAVAAIVNKHDEVLIARRPEGVHQGGLWEFPGGKMEPGESLEQAMARELDEELGIRVRHTQPLITIDYDYGDKRVCLHVQVVDVYEGEPHGREGQPLRWMSRRGLADLEFPAANHPIISALQLPDRYLITPDPGLQTEAFLIALRQRLSRGDIRLMQLRAPSLDEQHFTALAAQVLAVARDLDVRVLLNASPGLARSLGADGVHLNRTRLAQWQAEQTGGWLVGASVHNATELNLARGADFAVLSPVSYTASHPDVAPLGGEAFARLAHPAVIPVYALGGMSVDDVGLARRH
ncbi:MAG TPA: Nudix family hydrolase, partial [Thioalkalivibrio sp.]|nr:Nudix family hydrolase [Thioalkalivibrio sp.]